MSNFPTLTDDEIEMLLLIQSYHYMGRGPRLDNTKARRKLKKLGMIRSLTINQNVLLDAAAGGGYQWRLTNLGEEIVEPIRREIERELPGRVRGMRDALDAFRAGRKTTPTAQQSC